MEQVFILFVITSYTLLNLISGLKFTTEPSNKVVVLSQEVWWSCQATDDTYPLKYSWRRDGVLLPLHDNYVVHDNGTLWIRRVTYNDIGGYMCAATAGRMTILSATAALDIAYINPSFSTQPVSQSVILGDVVELSCYIESLPPAELAWTLNGNNISSGLVNVTSNGTSVLRLQPVMYHHAGTYKCTGTNPLTGVYRYSSESLLSVRGQPVFLTSLKSVTVPIDYNATFTCNFHGNPQPVVTWFVHVTHDNGGVTSKEVQRTDSKYTVYANGTFIVNRVTQQDEAYYTCTVGNAFGEMSESALLTVSGPASIPEITWVSPNMTVTAGEAASFVCQCSGNPVPSVTWTKNGSVLSENGSWTMESTGYIDADWYTCICENDEGTVNQSVYLDVLFRPTASISVKTVNIRRGDPMFVDCLTTGNPAPNITWKTPHFGSVTTSLSVVSIYSNGTLHIVTSTENDTGQYMCEATNSLGSATASISLTVQVPPKFTILPVSQGVLQGFSVYLHCRAQGVPEPIYTWSKDGEGIIRSSVGRQIYVNNSLVIHSTSHQDSGVYRCLAENLQGVTQSVATITVLVPPTFTKAPENSTMGIGGSIQLVCLVDGDPVPTQRWLKEDKQLIIDENMRASLDQSILSISGIRQSQFGKYSCVASSIAGTNTISAWINMLDVPVFTILPTDSTVSQSATLTLKCQGHAAEMPSVTWYQGREGTMKLLKNDSRVTVTDQGVLMIKSVQEETDEGWFTCVVSNTAGQISQAVFVNVQVSPIILLTNSPQSTALQSDVILSCLSYGDPTPWLQWISPAGHMISSSSTYVITDHSLRILSANENDVGNWTCQYCNHLGCDTALVTVEMEGVPVINWFGGNKINDLITLTCSVSGNPKSSVTFISEGQSVTSDLEGHTVTDNEIVVESGSVRPEYTCRAQNVYGTTMKAIAVPSQMEPPSVKTEDLSTVNLTWDLPSDLGDLPLTGYTIQLTSDLGVTWQQVEVTEDDLQMAVSYSVTGLKPFKEYRFRILAKNILGSGEFSTMSESVMITVQAPSPPRNVMILELGKHVILLQWEPSEHPNDDRADVVYEYKVTKLLKSDSGNTTTEIVHLQGTRTYNQTFQVEMQDLAEPVELRISVWARNSETNMSSDVVDIFVDLSSSAIPEAEAQMEESGLGTDKILAIAFGAVGGLIVVILIVFAVTYVRNRRKTKSLTLLDHRRSLDQFYMENPKTLYSSNSRLDKKFSPKRRSAQSFYSFDESFHSSRSKHMDSTEHIGSDTDNDVLLVSRSPLYQETTLTGSISQCNSADNLQDTAEGSCIPGEVDRPDTNISLERTIDSTGDQCEDSSNSAVEPPVSNSGIEPQASNRHSKSSSDIPLEHIYTSLPCTNDSVRTLAAYSPKTLTSTKPRPPTRVISPGQLRCVPNGQNISTKDGQKESKSDSNKSKPSSVKLNINGKRQNNIYNGDHRKSQEIKEAKQSVGKSDSSTNGSIGNLTDSKSCNGGHSSKSNGQLLDTDCEKLITNGFEHSKDQSLKSASRPKNVVDDNFLTESEIQQENELAVLY